MRFQVDTIPKFEKQVLKLARKHHHIQSDLLNFLDRLEVGNFTNDKAIPGFAHQVYKARVPSRDQNKGKRAGFRVIYYLVTDNQQIYLLSIYAKNEQMDIKPTEIMEILKRTDV